MAICHGRVGIREGTEEESPRSAAQVIASNDDLLTELLLCLPIKSLLKFKSVGKHWLSLVSDPRFIRRRNLQSKAVSALYLRCSTQDFRAYYEFVPLQNDPWQTFARVEYLNPADAPRGRIQIIQSCKGLFLCRSIRFGEDVKYLVYNPTTKQFKTLPPVPPVTPAPPAPPAASWADMLDCSVNLAFDPSISHLYKVVCILGDGDSGQILIYSSETGCWRVSGAPFTLPPPVVFGDGVYFNGAIHWHSVRDDSLYFDLEEEVVREMPMPPHPHPLNNDPYPHWRYFGESGGHLHLVDSDQHLTTHLNVYEMEQDRSRWFLKFRVDSDVLARLTMPYEDVHLKSVLHVDRGENEEDSFLVVYISNHKVLRYNLITQTHQEVLDIDSRPRSVSFAFQYIESLSLV